MKLLNQLLLTFCGVNCARTKYPRVPPAGNEDHTGIPGSIYTGKLYKDHGLFEFTIDSSETAAALRDLESNYNLDWLRPHRGATFALGTSVQILTTPADRLTFAQALQDAGNNKIPT